MTAKLWRAGDEGENWTVEWASAEERTTGTMHHAPPVEEAFGVQGAIAMWWMLEELSSSASVSKVSSLAVSQQVFARQRTLAEVREEICKDVLG